MSLKRRLGFDAEPVYIMDGTAFLFRGFFANANMTRSDGLPTGALYIVGRVLLKLLREERPEYFLFVMDGKGPNFRHALYPDYKANRPATPEGLIAQIAPVQDMIRAMGLRLEISAGCEADDCIASLCRRFREQRPVVIVGMDKDLRQCLAENVVLWDPASREEKLVTLDSFRRETGLEPSQWPDVQALIGDSSDNIPGVRGIGPKTAETLFKDFKNLEDIRDRLHQVPDKIRAKLDGNREAMFLYRRLTTLEIDRCRDVDLEDLRIRPLDGREAMALFSEYEMGSLKRDLALLARQGDPDSAEPGLAAGSASGNPSFAKPASAKPASVNPSDKLVSGKAGARTGRSAPQDARAAQAGAGGLGSVGAVQFSLLDDPSHTLQAYAASGGLAGESGDEPPLVPALADAAALPPCRGAILALTPPPADADLCPGGCQEQGSAMADYVLAMESTQGELWQVRYAGPEADLAAWAREADLLVTPDVKSLLRRHAAWWDRDPSRCFDLSLAAYLLAPEDRDYSWPRLSARQAEAAGVSRNMPGSLALALYRDLSARLEAAQLMPVLLAMELPLLPVLASMEQAGVRVDSGALRVFLDEVKADLDALSAGIFQAAGGEFNIRSAQQIGDVLYKRLGLPNARSTRGGQASTSQEVLEKLSGRHPVVDKLLEFRKLEKMRSTYLEPLPRLSGPDGRIRTRFNQSATATGRLSSSNPNLQNIPVRGDMGRRMRACFTAEAGNALISADYSQIELRVLAHYSQDPTLLEAFRNDEDIHTRTAALLHDLPPERITPDQRRGAKTINFGLIYGMGARKLANELHVPQAEAREFIDRYFARFSRIKAFYDQVEEDARLRGYVTTLSGRRRPLPDMRSQSAQARALAERQAVNTLIQGSAADIIKWAMLAVYGDGELSALSARLLLQVHDELVLELPSENAARAGERLALLMTALPGAGLSLSVPLRVDWGWGADWGSAH